MKKKLLVAIAAIFLLAYPALAQVKTSLNIQCDQVGAKVYIDGDLAGYTSPNFSTLLKPGLYEIRIVKDGYPEYRTKSLIASTPVTLVVKLSPQTPTPPPVKLYKLGVESNVFGAQVYIDGKYSGKTPFSANLSADTYQISVRQAGYVEFQKTIRLDSSYVIYADLELESLPVTIDSWNVPGAAVFRNSVYVGTVPYRSAWQPGDYDIRISASGYEDYIDRVSVRGPFSLQISLQPRQVEYRIELPNNFASGPNGPIGIENLRFYLDGRQLFAPYGRMSVGTHRLSFYLGDYRFDTEFTVDYGRAVVIQPFVGVTLR